MPKKKGKVTAVPPEPKRPKKKASIKAAAVHPQPEPPKEKTGTQVDAIFPQPKPTEEKASIKATAVLPQPEANEPKKPIKFVLGSPEGPNLAIQGEVIDTFTSSGIDEFPDQMEQDSSLPPIYLPYKIQHNILNATQAHLEQACFDFGERWLPELLKKKHWTCPEAVELGSWLDILAKESVKLPTEALQDSSSNLSDAVLADVVNLRHTAVHRVPVTGQRIQQMISSALKLVTTLKDTSRESKMEHLFRELEICLGSVDETRTSLRRTLDQERADIDRARSELDQREKRAVATMMEGEETQLLAASSSLDRTVNEIFLGAGSTETVLSFRNFTIVRLRQ